MKKMKSLLSLLLCLTLLAAAGLSAMASAEETAQAPTEFVIPATDTEAEIVIPLTGTKEEPVALGEGGAKFLFETVDPDGYESWFEISTDEVLLSDALLSLGLIAGSDSEYGLYVDTVCGLQLIYTDETPVYWSFLINGEYADHGVSSEEVQSGAVYSLVAEAYTAQ